jgi:Reverse transcriptase (RNA-dependent DNA polymerase)
MADSILDLARTQGSLAAKTAADVIDSQLTAFALKAERDTSNKLFGYAWSPTLADAGRSVTFWRNCLRMVKAGADPFASLLPSQLITHSGLRPTLAMSFYQARLADAWTKLRTIQAKATELRAEFLDSLCDAAECHTEKARATCIRGIKKAEYMQRLWPKLRRFAKGEVRTGLSRIEVPIFDASQEIVGWRSITSPDELFTALINRNIKHFSQAKDTPFVNGVFGQHLHPFEQNDFSESILNGEIDLSSFEINTAIQACIQTMKFAPGEDGTSPVDSRITIKDFQHGFKSIPERISSSPSGRHIGHYKAILTDMELCEIMSTLSSLPFEYGFSLQRWERVIQVVLEKVRGTPRIDKIRIIQLVEIDFNQALKKIFGHRLVRHAESKGNIPPSQWGSRPNKSAIDCVLLKRLSYDGLKIMRHTAIIFNNDAKAAFDRMVPSVGGIALRRLGAHKLAVDTLLKTLLQMKYQIRTALGLSEEAYSNVEEWVLGTLQGSGASPCLWLAIMCILLGALDQNSQGLTFRNPRGTSELRRTADAYVDDTELFVTLKNADLLTLAKEMQTTAQFWEQLLYTTGGALALEKCFFVAMDWVWENDTYRPRTKIEQPLTISLFSGGNPNDITTILQKDPSDGPRNLGVMLAPDGNNTNDLTALCTKGSSVSSNIAASPLSRGEVRFAYFRMLRPSMRYALGATTFTQPECHKIDRSYLPIFLSRMGINRNTKRLLIFGPPLLGGLGFTDTFTDQGISQLQAFIGHIRLNQDIGCLVHILLEHLQLHIGSEDPLFA